MEEMSINWLALIVSAIVVLPLGFIWYHPKVFGTAWMNATGMTEEKAQEGNMALRYGLSVVFAFMAAFALNLLVNGHGEEFITFKHGAFHGSILAIMLVGPAIITNAMYEQRNIKGALINWGYWIVTFAVIGGIVNAWH